MTELGHILIMRLINKYKEGTRWWRPEYSFVLCPLPCTSALCLLPQGRRPLLGLWLFTSPLTWALKVEILTQLPFIHGNDHLKNKLVSFLIGRWLERTAGWPVFARVTLMSLWTWNWLACLTLLHFKPTRPFLWSYMRPFSNLLGCWHHSFPTPFVATCPSVSIHTCRPNKADY